MQNVVVGIGEILWDMLPSGKVIGGAPANFSYHVQESVSYTHLRAHET